MKRNKTFFKKWIADLRSRKWKQGIGALRSFDTHCCLGVACEVLGLPKSEDCGFNIGDGDYINGTLPPSILNKIGLSAEEQGDLVEMNDHGKKFYQIANYIEKKILAEAKK